MSGGGAPREGIEGGKFVAQFEDDAFGCFFSEAFEFGERGDVTGGDGISDGLRGGAGEDGECGFGADT